MITINFLDKSQKNRHYLTLLVRQKNDATTIDANLINFLQNYEHGYLVRIALKRILKNNVLHL